MLNPSIIVVTGPTASGKTDLAISLAKKYDAEIINADSVQVYQGFNIGSAKPSEQDLAEVPHHLFSVLGAKEEFNAGVFCKLAAEKIEEISQRGKLAIICGGTGLYIQSLLHGLIAAEEPSEEARNKLEMLEQEYQAESEVVSLSEFLHARLAEVDQDTASNLKPSDISRIKRALVYYFSTGESFYLSQTKHKFASNIYRAFVIVVLPDRQELYQKIEQRVEQMQEQGLVDEVKQLLSQYPKDLKPFSSIGYKEVVSYLENQISHREMLDKIKQHTRNLAKRQMTWWRNQPEKLSWEKLDDQISLSSQIVDFLEKKERFIDREIFYKVIGHNRQS